MHTPSPCSTGSVPSRLEWRPSRLQAVAEAVVLLAAPWLIGASGMPVRLQPPAVLLCWGLGELVARAAVAGALRFLSNVKRTSL